MTEPLSQRQFARDLLQAHGIVHRAELRGVGVAAATVSRKERDGEVVRLARGLYQISDAPLETGHRLAGSAKRLSKGVAGAAAFILVVGVMIWAGTATHAWTPAQPDYTWSFPRDHWARDGYKTEWWYFTGHLRSAGEPVRRFGFQFTFFRIGVSQAAPPSGSAWAAGNIIMGHAALTDLDNGRHRFSELVVRAAPLLGGFGRHPDPRLAWSVGPPGTPDPWQLHWNGNGFDFTMADAEKGFGFSVSTRPLKPLVFQGPGGLSRKGEDATEASHYYSFTRMAAIGTVRLDSREWEVSGTSWMDKEFGSNQLGEETVGWDWFSLQLDDGREVMLYLLRSRKGAIHHAGATLVNSAGAVRYLQPDEWKLNATGRWTSLATGAPYPAGWTLEIPSAALRAVISPRLAEQENRSELIPNLFYWEGSVRVQSESDEPMGQGYVELTGYGEDSRPPM